MLKIYKILFFTLTYITVSCSDNFQRVEYNLPDDPTHKLEEIFRISEPVEGSFFTNYPNINFLSNDHLIVQNYPDQKLYEFSADGELIDTIGGRGKGPGEFLDITRSLLGANDSLHIYDYNFAKHQVFKKEENEWHPVRDRTLSWEDITPFEVYKRSKTEYVGRFSFRPEDSENDATKIYSYLSQVDHNMVQVGDTTSLKPTGDTATIRNGNSRSSAPNIRFFKAFYLYRPVTDEVIYIQNTSNEIVVVNSNGGEEITGYLPYNQFPARQEEINASLEPYADFAPELADLVRSKTLDHEPYYWNIALINENQLLINLAREDLTKPNWIITLLTGEILKSFHGPEKLWNVGMNNGKIYGIIKEPNGEVYLVGYEILET